MPLLCGMVESIPCIPEQVDCVMAFLRCQLVGTMVEMMRYSVEKGAHKGNLIFTEASVDAMMPGFESILRRGDTGATLYRGMLSVMREAIAATTHREILGEKTPNNIFSMAAYGKHFKETLSVAVAREPFGVLRSMQGRVLGGDRYSDAFDGTLERNLGIYIEYARAIREVLESPNSMLVRFEDMSFDPQEVLKRMYAYWDREPDDRALNFVENGNDPEVANRAPMFYRRLQVRSSPELFTPGESWKIAALTRGVRSVLGYPDDYLSAIGWDIPAEWEGTIEESVVLGLDGFYPPNEEGALYLRKRGSLVVYLKKARRHTLDLKFWSDYPETIDPEEIKVVISINGKLVGELQLGVGPTVTCFDYEFNDDELRPMNNDNRYAVIELYATRTFAPIATVAGGTCANERSVLLYDYSVESV